MNNSRDWPLTAPIHTQTCTCTPPHTPCLTHMCMCRHSVKNKSAGWNFSLISNLRWRRIYSYAYVVHQVHFSVAGKSTVSLHPLPPPDYGPENIFSSVPCKPLKRAGCNRWPVFIKARHRYWFSARQVIISHTVITGMRSHQLLLYSLG